MDSMDAADSQAVKEELQRMKTVPPSQKELTAAEKNLRTQKSEDEARRNYQMFMGNLYYGERQIQNY